MPASQQLLLRGLFPCAPTFPSLAVDINMLQFVKELFARMPPKNTAWSNTLEAFLVARKYKLKTNVRIVLQSECGCKSDSQIRIACAVALEVHSSGTPP